MSENYIETGLEM